MATTTAYSGTMSLKLAHKVTFGGDTEGAQSISDNALEAVLFAASGGDAPTISGFLKGTAVCAAGDWLLAHATDPLQGMGNAVYPAGFDPASSKLKLLLVRNTDTTNSITIIRGAANGLPVFLAAGDGITIAPGGAHLFYDPTGTAALTTGSNDKLTISVSAGSPSAVVYAVYGP